MSDEVPNFLALDLESARHAVRNADPGKVPISVLSAWGLRDLAPRIWLLDSSRLPRVMVAEADMETVFAGYDGVVTWNGLKFDVPCMRGRLAAVARTFRKKPHIDLHAMCCLLACGVEVDRLTNLDHDWHRLTPTIRSDLLSAGWSLGAVTAGSIGIGKLEGPQGSGAVDAWLDGAYSPVITYNVWDTALLRELYLRAWRDGYLISRERGRVEIPRAALGG